MTVRELIDKLQDQPTSAEVCVLGYTSDMDIDLLDVDEVDFVNGRVRIHCLDPEDDEEDEESDD